MTWAGYFVVRDNNYVNFFSLMEVGFSIHQRVTREYLARKTEASVAWLQRYTKGFR